MKGEIMGDLAVSVSAKALALVEQARAMLAEARDLSEVKEVIGKAEAIRHYMKQQGEATEAQNIAAEVKLRAERRAGELLREMPKQRPGEYQRLHDATVAPALEEIGIEKTQSHRYQAIASVPEEIFEEHIEEAKAKGKPITTNGALRLAKQLQSPPEPVATVWNVHGAVDELIDTLREMFTSWPEPKRPIFGAKLRDIGNEILRTGDMPE